VLERVVLGPDRNLMVVRVKDRVLLLGVTAHHISQLAELDAAHYAGLPAPSQNGDRFATLLRESIGFGIGSDKPPTRKE
jgi:flagellar biogenesis protein FliO